MVRRYGLGTIAYPAPPIPVPAVRLDGDGTDGRAPRHRRRSGDAADPMSPDRRPVSPQPVAADDTAQSVRPDPSARAVPDPVTQPDPGT